MTGPFPRRSISLLLAATVVLAACGEPDADAGPVAASDDEFTADDDVAETDATTTAGRGTTPADATTGKPSVALPAETPTELVVTDVVAGTGEPAEIGDTIELNYVGVRSADGTEFDNSYDSGQPLIVTLGATQLIQGFTAGLEGAQTGTRRQLDIPAALAYGEQGAGGIIGPGDAISFVIDVVSVTKRTSPTIPPMADPSECPAIDGSEEQRREFDAYPPFCIDGTATYTADIVTNFGDISVELYPERAPLAVNNFVTLARYRYFDGTECHRAIPSFVVQCGDPTATGTGGPGYQFDDELPLPGEYVAGSLAMANAGPNTNGSQFFIITGPSGAALPPQYSLFGEVIGGFESTVADLDGVANPENNGVPPLDRIVIESVTVTGP